MHDEQQQARRLRRYRWLAGGLLILMAGLFLLSHLLPADGVWVRLLQAASEAGVVGGLADWFAVTALFRHPLGLPIPHTAIVPKNKARIGEGLGRFVTRNFLVPELVAQRLRSLDPAVRLSRWLGRRHNADWLAERSVELFPALVNAVGDAEMKRLVARALSSGLAGRELQPVLARGMRMLAHSPEYQRVLDRLSAAARDLLRGNQAWIVAKVSERSRWWVPERVDRRLAETILASVEDLLDALSRGDHPVRRDFDASVTALIDRFEQSDRAGVELERIKDELLRSPEAAGALAGAWARIREGALAAMERERPAVRESVAESLRRLGVRLRADPAARARLNARMEAFAARAVVPFRVEIGRFIAQIVEDWDTDTVTRRLELAVGRDLQFIRVNGTLVGALVGAALFGLARIL